MENNEDIKDAKKVYDEINEDEHEKYLAELRQKYIMDMYDFEETGFDKGMAKGIEKIVKKMLSMNKSIEEISEITDLSVSEINKIKKENNL